ncbi:hypothetical protein BC940DRAFT_267109 [Gongronella butleri]|nr:hypothetical protein BC940DRAFT_267109 [Gongronella butleri]
MLRFLHVVGLVLFLLVASLPRTFACEPPCRHAIAKAFTQQYWPLVQQVMAQLDMPLTRPVYKRPPPYQLTDVVPVDVLQETLADTARQVVKAFVNDTSYGLEEQIYNVMFNEEEPFKGDCSSPPRLDRKMPPEGEAWTMDECRRMDYRCGNPPSICHHIDLIKTRIVKRIQSQLSVTAAFDGPLYQPIAQECKENVKHILTKYGGAALLRDASIMAYTNDVVTDIRLALEDWITDHVNTMCTNPEQEEYCGGWEYALKLEILKWP